MGAPFKIASRSSCLILDGADDGGENGTRNTPTGHLADDAADIRRRGRIGEQRKEHSENLSPDPAADCTREGVPKRTEVDILGGTRGDISADGAANDLYDEVDEQSRHRAILPRSGVRS